MKGKERAIETVQSEEFPDYVRQGVQAIEALRRVMALCDHWDVITKGESPTTKQIRQAIRGEVT